jgi:hypothetical protein
MDTNKTTTYKMAAKGKAAKKQSTKKSPYVYHGETFTITMNPKVFIGKNVPAVRISQLPIEVTDAARRYLLSTAARNLFSQQLNAALGSGSYAAAVIDYIHVGRESLQATIHGHIEIMGEPNTDDEQFPKGYVKELLVDSLSRKQSVHAFSNEGEDYSFCFNNPKQPTWSWD